MAAWEAVVDGLLQDVDPGSRSAFLFLDLRVRAGNLLAAIVNKRSSFTNGLYYLGLIDNMIEFEWVTDRMVKTLAAKLADGSLKLPGVDVGPSERFQYQSPIWNGYDVRKLSYGVYTTMYGHRFLIS